MLAETGLETRYVPVATYFEESDSVEYVRRDVATFYRRVDPILTLVYDLFEKELIGFRLKGFRNFYIRHLQTEVEEDDRRFLAVVRVLEKAFQVLGDQMFESDQNERRDAYRQAQQIATEDKVTLADLPDAA